MRAHIPNIVQHISISKKSVNSLRKVWQYLNQWFVNRFDVQSLLFEFPFAHFKHISGVLSSWSPFSIETTKRTTMNRRIPPLLCSVFIMCWCFGFCKMRYSEVNVAKVSETVDPDLGNCNYTRWAYLILKGTPSLTIHNNTKWVTIENIHRSGSHE